MILFNIGVFLTSKILEDTIDDIFPSEALYYLYACCPQWSFEIISFAMEVDISM
jgi:hypothetical protein